MMNGEVQGQAAPIQNDTLLGDFAALFEELAHDDAAAPLELGLRRMCGNIDILRRPVPAG